MEIFSDLPDTVENVGKGDFDAPLSGDNLQRFEDPQLSGLLICVKLKKKCHIALVIKHNQSLILKWSLDLQ